MNLKMFASSEEKDAYLNTRRSTIVIARSATWTNCCHATYICFSIPLLDSCDAQNKVKVGILERIHSLLYLVVAAKTALDA
jgi:hypothetical protein